MENSTETNNQSNNAIQQNLPNHVAVLVLGICSIVFSFCCSLIGIIPGIIALVLASNSTKLYSAAPENYTVSSFKNIKAGRICALIGIVVGALFFVLSLVLNIGFGLMEAASMADLYNY